MRIAFNCRETTVADINLEQKRAKDIYGGLYPLLLLVTPHLLVRLDLAKKLLMVPLLISGYQFGMSARSASTSSQDSSLFKHPLLKR